MKDNLYAQECEKCLKSDVCKHIIEKHKITDKIKEISNSQEIVSISLSCKHYRPDPHML